MAEAASVNENAVQAELAGLPSPAELFQGYDSVTGGGLSKAVEGKSTTVGGTTSVIYRVCTDLETLSEALEINQSLSIAYGPIGSLDQKLKFVRSLKVTTNSISIVIFARHTLGTETMTEVALKSGVSPPKDAEKMREFFRGYGDSFVSSLTRGGEYYAVYTYYSQSREEQNELTLDMKAHGIFTGGSVDVGFQIKLNKFNSSTKVRAELDQNISGIANPKLPDSDKIIAFALEFPSLQLTAPAVIGYDTTGYERVPGFGAFQPIARNRDFFVGTGALDGLTKPLVQIRELENQIAWLRAVYKFYGGYTDNKVDSVAAQAKTDNETVNALIRRYQDDPTGSFERPNLPSLKDGSPALKYTVLRSPEYGGTGGDPFDDVDVRSFIPEQTRISALQLKSGDRIDKLITTYRNANRSWTIERGGNGGKLGNKYDLLPGDVVTSVDGRSDRRVDRLVFHISNGTTVSGGEMGGKEFSWPVPDGAFLLGFSGRSLAEVDKIQFVYGKFEPATWSGI